MNQVDVFGKDVFQSKAVNGMRVSTANFHQAIVAPGIGKASNLVRHFADQFGFTEFIYKSHCASPPGPSRTGSTCFPILDILQAITLYLLHHRFALAKDAERLHLIERILFADLAHGESDMD